MKTLKDIVVVKYGGNAMTNNSLKQAVLENLLKVKNAGNDLVIVHGGGPFIQEALEMAQLESEFIDGHRKTTKQALRYVEMALKGDVNASLVNLLNTLGAKAVGLSGKDGNMVEAQKREYKKQVDNQWKSFDLGQVGDVVSVDTHLIQVLLQNNFIPVITCIASNKKGDDFNINADMFAGHIAGALKAKRFVALTDVDGVMSDKDDPSTLLPSISHAEVDQLLENDVLLGGMIPKVEASFIALERGAASAGIMNGKKPENLAKIHEQTQVFGTEFKL